MAKLDLEKVDAFHTTDKQALDILNHIQKQYLNIDNFKVYVFETEEKISLNQIAEKIKRKEPNCLSYIRALTGFIPHLGSELNQSSQEIENIFRRILLNKQEITNFMEVTNKELKERESEIIFLKATVINLQKNNEKLLQQVDYFKQFAPQIPIEVKENGLELKPKKPTNIKSLLE